MTVFLRGLLTILLALSVSILAGCGDDRITRAEAERILDEAMGYPAPRARMAVRIAEGGGRYVSVIRELVVQGYLQQGVKEGGQTVHVPTGKGRAHVESATYMKTSDDYRLLFLDVYVGEEYCDWLTGVKELDGGERLEITYEWKWRRAEPFYSLLCNDEDCPYYGGNIEKEGTRTVVLEQRYGLWRPVALELGP
ncbi:MAG: hypothetical protein ACLFOY_00535 [Desulfatibacillaceae bacterium]